jgi:hypothetical protein
MGKRAQRSRKQENRIYSIQERVAEKCDTLRCTASRNKDHDVSSQRRIFRSSSRKVGRPSLLKWQIESVQLLRRHNVLLREIKGITGLSVVTILKYS